MYDSMNALLKTMESMKSDVSGVKGGLANLDQARGNRQCEPETDRGAIDTGACRSAGGHGQTTVMIPYLQTARDAVTVLTATHRRFPIRGRYAG